MWINCGKKSTPVDNLIGLEKNCRNKNITNLKEYRGVDKKKNNTFLWKNLKFIKRGKKNNSYLFVDLL